MTPFERYKFFLQHTDTSVTHEQQIAVLRSMVEAFICEHLNDQYDCIKINDIDQLILEIKDEKISGLC